MDWRDMIEPAKAELRRLRAQGLSVNEALDRMRGRGYTLPAVNEALQDVESMSPEEYHQLFDERGDWDEF